MVVNNVVVVDGPVDVEVVVETSCTLSTINIIVDYQQLNNWHNITVQWNLLFYWHIHLF